MKNMIGNALWKKAKGFVKKGFDAKLIILLGKITGEFKRANAKYPRFASRHEGYAILKEEVDELWEEIKRKPEATDMNKVKEEAIQVAAMALRFLYDLCE